MQESSRAREEKVLCGAGSVGRAGIPEPWGSSGENFLF